MFRKFYRGLTAYKEVDPEKVDEVEEQIIDGAVVVAVVATSIVFKLLWDNHQIRNELEVIRNNQKFIFAAAVNKGD